ncbi:hypothetical protein DPSP01_008655 [Paraphaeosphaeria sporulosa]
MSKDMIFDIYKLLDEEGMQGPAIDLRAAPRAYSWFPSKHPMNLDPTDEEEVSSEIARMPDIYSGAVITIAASTAASADDGFLKNRNCGSNIHMQVQVECYDRDIRSMGILKFAENQREEEQLPLNKRSWALQEHRLSTRILHHSTRQLSFICAVSNRTSSSVYTYTDVWIKTMHFSSILEAVTPPSLSHELVSTDGRCWDTIVRTYSNRELTYPKDRVLATSGIATKLQKYRSNKTYIAGHWLGGTSYDLLWFAGGKELDRGYNATHSDTNWLGPSWAWTRMSGTVRCAARGTVTSYETEQEELTQWQRIREMKIVHRTLVNMTAPYDGVHEAVLGGTTLARRYRVKKNSAQEEYLMDTKIPYHEHGIMAIQLDNSEQHRDKALLASPVLVIIARFHPDFVDFISEGVGCGAHGLILVEVPRSNRDETPRFERHGFFHAY